jgi:hypothetical protein
MIYDRIEMMDHYAPILGDVAALQRLLSDKQEIEEGYAVHRTAGEVRPFDGTLYAQKEQMVLHTVTQGCHSVALGFAERVQGVQVNTYGVFVLEDSPVSFVVTLKTGWFVLFMPGEPHALSLEGEGCSATSESVTILFA